MVRAGGGLARLGLLTGMAALRAGAPRSCTTAARLQEFSSRALPVRDSVQVRWNQHQVPFIEAASDHDLAVALGAVHAHLRLGQIELMRRIAKGRLAEAVGPAAVPVDYALRLLNMERAVPAIMAKLPEETLVWLAGFAEGLNAYIEKRSGRPYDLNVLGLDPQPWSVPT
jgi:penicillin amidase